jgi:hypothetical protein
MHSSFGDVLKIPRCPLRVASHPLPAMPHPLSVARVPVTAALTDPLFAAWNGSLALHRWF